MIDCSLSHDAVMNALIQSPTDHPSNDTLVTCLVISSKAIDQYNPLIEHESIAKSFKAIYDTSLRRSWDGHLLIELPPLTDQINASSPTDNQSNSGQESSLTATASHSKESEITCRNLEENDEEHVDLMQCRPLTLFESVIDYMLDNMQPTSSSQYTCGDSAFDFCFKYFGQALKETNLTLLDLGGNKIRSDLFFDFVKHVKGSQIATLNLPIVDHNSSKSVIKDLAKCSTDDNVRTSHKSNKIDITLVDSSCDENAQSLEFLPTILKDTQIRSLDFSFNPIDLKMLSSSLVGSNITFLGLRGCKIKKDGLICLAPILKYTQIASIDLGDNRLNCESLKIFASGLAGTKITSLNLSHNKIGVDGMNCLGSVLKNTQITSIDISYNEWRYGEWSYNEWRYKSLKVFINCLVDSKITSIFLKNWYHIGVDDVKCLGSVLKNTQITSISIGGLSYESLEALSAGLVGSKINSLNLRYDNFNTLQCLGQVLKKTQIEVIDLSDYNLNPRDILEEFAPCLVDTKITHLGLAGNKMGIRKLNCLGNVLKNTQITSIDISGNDIQGVSELCLIDTKITALGLSSNSLGTDQLKYLGENLKLSKITSIDLSNNHLNSESINTFVPFLVDSNITSLDLSGNCFDHSAIEYLASVLKNTQITSLKLAHCNLKCNSLRNLVMCLPDTKITSLYLSGNFICCNLFYLAFVLKHTQITSLNISNDYSSQYNSTSILEMLNEDSLDLSYRNLCTFSLRFLACILKHTKITSLNLCYSEIGCEGLKYLSQGIVGSQIASLGLNGNCIKGEGANYLAECLADTKIVELGLSDNIIENEAAYQLCKSVCQKKVDFNMLVTNCKADGAVPYRLSLYRYPGCSIEINEIVPTNKGDSDRLISKTYEKSGITKLIYTGDYSVNLDGSLDNINITEIEFKKDGNQTGIASVFEKSNIAKLKIAADHHMLELLLKMNVIALDLENRYSLDLSYIKLKSVLLDSNIVYLDLSNNRDDFENFVDLLNGSKIISLDLSNTQLGAKSVELLAKVLPDTKLTYIDLHGNEIGYPELKHLLEIVEKTSICWLSLGNNYIEEGLQSKVELSPYIVPRNDTPIEFQIRFLFRELVSLNTATEQFEFIVPRDEHSVMTINHYPRLVKHLQDTPIYKMHIYDYFYMQNMRRHDIHVLNRINFFVKGLKQNFISFFESKMMQIGEKFGYDSFVSLVKECVSLNLTDFVELLLLHRVLYYVDDEQNFLHPFIYEMLHKYQMPLYNEDLEPNKKQQIISYFEEHSDIDGAREIIDLLK